MDNNSEALQYGYGLFETILIKNGEIEYFDEHYKRACSALSYLGMNLMTKDQLLFDLSKYVEDNNLVFGVVKICFYLDKGRTIIVFYNRQFPYKENDYINGYKLCLSSIKRHSENPIYKIKSTNFINNNLEMKTIKDNGYNEAIHLNENNYITEGIYSNLFFVRNGEIYTPHVDLGLLAGIMRQKIIDGSKKIGLKINIGYYNIDDLKNADEVFLTSSVLGIMRVSSFEDIHYEKLSNSLIEQLLKEI